MKSLILVATLAVVNGGRLGNDAALASYGISVSASATSGSEAAPCRVDQPRALGGAPTLGQDSTAVPQWTRFEPPPPLGPGGGIGGVYQCPFFAPVLRCDWTGWCWCSPY
jgi:hypothetical protein